MEGVVFFPLSWLFFLGRVSQRVLWTVIGGAEIGSDLATAKKKRGQPTNVNIGKGQPLGLNMHAPRQKSGSAAAVVTWLVSFDSWLAHHFLPHLSHSLALFCR